MTQQTLAALFPVATYGYCLILHGRKWFSQDDCLVTKDEHSVIWLNHRHTTPGRTEVYALTVKT